MRLSRRRSIAVAIAALVAADWGTKFAVANQVRLFDEHKLVDGWVWLSHHENPGISFGLLTGLPDPWRTLLLAALSLAGIAMCVHLVVTAPDRRVRWAAALVLAGALGNLGDRLLDGSVTDFIRVEHFPYIFNVADIAITVGAFVLGTLLALDPRARGEGDAAPV